MKIICNKLFINKNYHFIKITHTFISTIKQFHYLRDVPQRHFLFNQLLTTFKLTIMKKVFLLSAAALFSLAIVATSCSKDDDDTCISCTDGETTLEYCYEEGNAIDALAKWSEFVSNHPDHTDCDE